MAETITVTPVGGSTTTFSDPNTSFAFTAGSMYWIDQPRYSSMLHSEHDLQRAFGAPIKIDLGEAGRPMQFTVLIWGSNKSDCMDRYKDIADTWRGKFNTVVIFDETFNNCSFLGEDLAGAEWIIGGTGGTVAYKIAIGFKQLAT